jgi:acyl dehydratase
MTLDHSLVGADLKGGTETWDSTATLLYAVAVGAGRDDPIADLALTTENSIGIAQQALPTFATLLGGRVPPVGDFDMTKFFHAGQGLTVHRPLPPAGSAIPTYRVDGIDEKRSGVLVRTSTDLHDADSGELLCTTASDFFIRGETGSAGTPGAAADWSLPDRAPDAQVDVPTLPGQALLYRLTGDRNPLHSDPEFARQAGFDRPILHGMCTYGMTGRVVLSTFAGGDPGRLASLHARFSKPVTPGQTLTVQLWADGDRALFRTLVGDQVVLDNGVAHRLS